MTGAVVEPWATLVKSAMCRTRVHHRPWPSLFYFPGLATQPIWHHHDRPVAIHEARNPSHFKFMSQLENAYPDILKEYLKLKCLKSKSDYAPEDHKLHSGQWDWLSYVQKGKRQEDFAIHCPKTVALLESFRNPSLMLNTPFSFTFFSTLHGNSTIAAHTSPCNLRVRCHLPLIVPTEGDVGIRIANEIVRWKPGKALLFDDAYDHEGAYCPL
jgi:aspartyl/asparaginyl beta-hydroxylase (cupin superfamily)